MKQREGLFLNVRGPLSFQSQLKVGGTKEIVPFSYSFFPGEKIKFIRIRDAERSVTKFAGTHS